MLARRGVQQGEDDSFLSLVVGASQPARAFQDPATLARIWKRVRQIITLTLLLAGTLTTAFVLAPDVEV